MFLVKPQEGKRVRHPDTKQVLTDEGCRIEHKSTYWFRREQAGDVSIEEIQPESAPVNGQGE